MPLPVPIASFEEYMLWDDYPAYPMNFFLRLGFAGRVDRAAFDRALGIAVGRHPLLCATLQPWKGKRLEWVARTDRTPSTTWLDAEPAVAFPFAQQIDLRSDPGLRVWGSEGDERSTIVLQIHHACCDGVGAFQFVNDLLVAYAIEMKEPSRRAVLKPLQNDRLRHRGKFGLTFARLMRMLPKQCVGLLGVVQFASRKPVPVIEGEVANLQDAPPTSFPTAHTVSLSKAESSLLRSAHEYLHATTNDVFARDLFLAIGQWRLRHAEQNGADRRDANPWIRLSVPINLRTAEDKSLPAANVVSMVFLDRQVEHFAAPDELLQGIHDETMLIKEKQLGMTLIMSLWAARFVKRSLAGLLPTDRCQSTCVLSNLGSPLARTPLPRKQGRIVAGNLVLDDLEILATIRPLTWVSFAVFEYASVFHVTIHFDTRVVTAEQAEDLLDVFREQIRESVRQIEAAKRGSDF